MGACLAGAEVDATEAPGMPPLLLRAAADGRLAMVKALVKRAHVNYMHEDKVTPLSAALEKGHLDVAQVLIDNGAQVRQPSESAQSFQMILGYTLVMTSCSLSLGKGS